MSRHERQDEAAFNKQINEWKLVDLRDRLNLKKKVLTEIPCKECKKDFMSEGAHHRFCKKCRSKRN